MRKIFVLVLAQLSLLSCMERSNKEPMYKNTYYADTLDYVPDYGNKENVMFGSIESKKNYVFPTVDDCRKHVDSIKAIKNNDSMEDDYEITPKTVHKYLGNKNTNKFFGKRAGSETTTGTSSLPLGVDTNDTTKTVHKYFGNIKETPLSELSGAQTYFLLPNYETRSINGTSFVVEKNTPDYIIESFRETIGNY